MKNRRALLASGVAAALAAAGVTIAALPAAATGAASTVTVSRTDCAPEWSAAQPGTQTITVTNNSGLAGEINLDNAAGAIVGEIETIGPGTSAPLTATLGSGTYTFRCLMGSLAATASQPVAVSAATTGKVTAPVAVRPVTVNDLAPPNKLYQSYAAAQLTDLATAVALIETDLRQGKIPQAQRDWLTAQLDWERVGASYDSFGDLGLAVDGLPDGLPNGVNDPGFTGLHRLEYGLWHGQPATELLPVADTLAKNVATVRKNLTSDDLAGEIETIGPGTSAPLTATLGSGTYTFRCLMGSLAATASQPVAVSAATTSQPVAVSSGPDATVAAPVAVKPVTVGDLTPPNKLYQSYAAAQLTDLAKAVTLIESDLRRGKIPQAKADWLTAQLDWERVGASYDSFGDLGLAVDGFPDGLPNGVNDASFTGLHRLEYGLWHGQPAMELLPVADTLAKNVATVRKNLTSDDLAGDPTQLPIRAHEIIEDALRDHLSAIDDEGAGAAYAMTWADTQVDRTVLGYLANLVNERQPGLVATADRQLATLDAALLATQANGQWQSPTQVTLDQRQRVNAATGALLETLAAVPDLLEVPPTHLPAAPR